MSFGKIFESTFTGSMAGAGPVVFAVWSYVIATARPPGLVEINPVILSAMIGAPVKDINDAIEYLCKPDEHSRTKIHDGKRLIKVCEFTFEVPTWPKYRASRNDEERRAYNAEAKRKSRAKKKVSNNMSMTCQDGQPPSAAVSPSRSRSRSRRKKIHCAPESAKDVVPPKEAPAVKEKPPRPRDPLFDTLAAVCGWNIAECPKDGGKVAKALKVITEICPEVTPAEIERRAENYRVLWPDIPVTPFGLSGNWGMLDNASTPKPEKLLL